MTSEVEVKVGPGWNGLVGVLTVLFVALKLTHVINWSWWWVLSPLWISAGLIAAVVIVSAVVMLIVSAFRK